LNNFSNFGRSTFFIVVVTLALNARCLDAWAQTPTDPQGGPRSLLTGKIVKIVFSDPRADRRNTREIHDSVFTALKRTFPETVLEEVESLRDGQTQEGSLSIEVSVSDHGATFKAPRWTGVTIFNVTLEDNRFGEPMKVQSSVVGAGDSKWNMWGDKTARAVERSSIPKASSAVVQFLLDSVLSPQATSSAAAAATRIRNDRARLATEYAQMLARLELEYAELGMKEGTSGIRGQAFLTTRGGDVKLAAGRRVTLEPFVPATRSWYESHGNYFDPLSSPDWYKRLTRETTADAEGRFSFSGLPPGEYLIRTSVTWSTGAPIGLEGGEVSLIESVAQREVKDVVVSKMTNPQPKAAISR
jgi:hypothetical protein